MKALAAAALAGSMILVAATAFLTNPVLSAECGLASWYGQESGNRTANGERFTGQDMTAAHKTMPFGTVLRVKYQGRAVTVRVNDRGPFIRGRSLDLSRAAASKLGLIPAGVGRVCWERVR